MGIVLITVAADVDDYYHYDADRIPTTTHSYNYNGRQPIPPPLPSAVASSNFGLGAALLVAALIEAPLLYVVYNCYKYLKEKKKLAAGWGPEVIPIQTLSSSTQTADSGNLRV